jgi:hypothetical protein
VYTEFAPYSPSYTLIPHPTPFPLIPTPTPQDLFCSPVLQFCKKKKVTFFLCKIHRDFFVTFPCIYVL